jgi:hypothetical protein
MTRLSDEHLDELLRMEEKATPEPWEASFNVVSLDDCELLGPEIHENGDRVVIAADENSEPPDFQFIAAARNALRPLVEEIRELRKERKVMRDGLDKADDLLRGWMKSDRRLREALEWIAATHLCLASTDDAQLNAASLRALVEKARAALKGDGA